MKRHIAILSVVIGTLLFLLGCSKSNSDTIAFVGNESEMVTCYDIYPQQFFPTGMSQNIKEGRFPPDVVGEFEMNGEFVECTYEFYNGNYYMPVPVMSPKTIKIIIEEQVNGLAKLRFATKRNGEYKNWHTVDAYIYGDVYAQSGKNDFIICYEYLENSGDFKYERGNIIKGTISDEGINDIQVWSIIKDRDPKEDKPMIYNYNGYEHYHANIAERQ